MKKKQYTKTGLKRTYSGKGKRVVDYNTLTKEELAKECYSLNERRKQGYALYFQLLDEVIKKASIEAEKWKGQLKLTGDSNFELPKHLMDCIVESAKDLTCPFCKDKIWSSSEKEKKMKEIQNTKKTEEEDDEEDKGYLHDNCATSCGHIIHRKCLEELSAEKEDEKCCYKSCPVCRAEIKLFKK